MASLRTPPGPRLPRPMQMAMLMRGEDSWSEKLQAQYGDVFRLHFEPKPWNIVCHPDAIRQVFTASPKVLHAGEANAILGPPLGSHSLLLLDEDPHLRQRRLLLPTLHGDHLRAQREAMEHAAERQVHRMPPGRPFSLRPHAQAIALEVILDVVLGTRGQEEHDRIEAPLLRLLEWIGAPRILLISAFLGPEHRVVKRMFAPYVTPVDDALYRLIRERRDATDLEERTDILSMLLLARDEDGASMTDAELRDELVTLIVAGHETTATALAWAFERLTRDPARLAVLEAESHTDETVYAEAVAKEALRLRPVLNNVLRVVKEPIEVGGFDIPVGEKVAPSIYLVHRNPEIYPDPGTFKPERWLDTKPGTYSWIPFGGGTRRCIGASFALTEMEVVLRAVTRSVHLEAVGEPEGAVPRFITTSPSRGGEVRLGSSPVASSAPPLVGVAR